MRVVEPVEGVSSCTRKDMFDSRRLVFEFHLSTAFGVIRPRKNTRDMSSVSAVALSVFMVKVLLCVPDIVVLAAERVFTFSISI